MFLLALVSIAGCASPDASVVLDTEVKDVMHEATEKAGRDIPDSLIQCDDEVFSEMDSCFDLPDEPVCGYDRTTYEDGRVETHGLEYRTPCHYCNFFGRDMERDMMGTYVKGLGYSTGACDR